MLLLIVLSMLTLFLMLGTAYLVVATRSRQTARAFARVALEAEGGDTSGANLLDYALLAVVRGGVVPAQSPVVTPPLVATPIFESLLGDKYGSSVTGTASAVTEIPNSPLITVTTAPQSKYSVGAETLAPADLVDVTDYPGRIVTLLGSGRRPTSHRVVRAEQSNTALTLVLEVAPSCKEFVLPSSAINPGGIPYIINGPEYRPHNFPKVTTTSTSRDTSTNESWDAFDASNPFLAHVLPKDSANTPPGETASVSRSVVNKLSFLDSNTTSTLQANGSLRSMPNGFAAGADNDGDGEIDGIFLDIGIPPSLASNGAPLRYDASVLIVDLDSRYNINAHGNYSDFLYPTGTSSPHVVKNATWASGTALRTVWTGTQSATVEVPLPSLTNSPVGSGYGPPEVNGRWLFAANSYPASIVRTPSSPQSYPVLLTISGADESGLIGKRPETSRFTDGSDTPRIAAFEGRYGEKGTLGSNLQTIYSGTASLSHAGFPMARPGEPGIDDSLSQISDRGINPYLPHLPANSGAPSEWWTGANAYNWVSATRSAYNAPPDLHGRMITVTATTSAQDVLPKLMYIKPEWGGTETTDDPYELRLSPEAARNVRYLSPSPAHDNIFGLAELEAVLRPYDHDSAQLPQRLAAALGSFAEEARLRLTTDSWDTTALTGQAATNIRDWLREAVRRNPTGVYGTTPLSGTINGEIARGERFNLNRPLTSSKPASYDPAHPYYVQRQAYFKDLYTLLVALSGTSTPASDRHRYAQWAANVVEFRDSDSTMTPFEYDVDPLNGWSVDGNVLTNTSEESSERAIAWGTERPELLIAATSAWEDSATGEMFFLLHRPWNAMALQKSGNSSTTTPGEPIDPALDYTADDKGRDVVNLSLKSSRAQFAVTDSNTYPVWRMRIVDPATSTTRYVRFDITKSGTGVTDELVSPNITQPYTIAADSWQCVMGGNTANMSVPASPHPAFAAFYAPGEKPIAGSSTPESRNVQVYLERLADPGSLITVSGTLPGTTKTGSAVWYAAPSDNDPASVSSLAMYRVVDQAVVEVVNREPSPGVDQNPYTVVRRQPATLWKPATNGPGKADMSLQPSDFGVSDATQRPMWLPWNNRPFSSSAELYLVPGNDPLTAQNGQHAVGMLQQYARPASSAALPALAGGFIPNGFFDAVHVPTRFSGIHTTASDVSTAALEASAGIFTSTTPINQLSSFREPGRVNLNTVSADDVWNAVVAGPLQSSGTAQPAKARNEAHFSTTPAQGMHDLLSLTGSNSFSASGTLPPLQDTHAALAAQQNLNPASLIYTASRLANTTTTRSNIFGIWITVRESIADDPDSVKIHRGFYIFDRSVPVAFDAGKDHNVWDAVRLRRIIQ